MKKRDNPHFPEGTLLAYVDGEAPADIVAHVRQCAQCQREVAELREMQDLFRAALKKPSKDL